MTSKNPNVKSVLALVALMFGVAMLHVGVATLASSFVFFGLERHLVHSSDMDVESMVDVHCSTRNAILELYAQFVDVEKGGLSSTTILVNLSQEQEVESPTT
ncbi:hypothetical protein PVK06_008341 [Gossypium arboreum]|uniref:Transmembrane protein n=1 Tax=Gossypium arboreum TaxID=29729 RepID=A0ABR0QK13_GOSAR|nr:hypothetical protein PVK06_008341 [Gossypium arboreum]